MSFDDYLDCYLHALGGENRATLRGDRERALTWRRVQGVYARLMRAATLAAG
jgi:hypothetical protein